MMTDIEQYRGDIINEMIVINPGAWSRWYRFKRWLRRLPTDRLTDTEVSKISEYFQWKFGSSGYPIEGLYSNPKGKP